MKMAKLSVLLALFVAVAVFCVSCGQHETSALSDSADAVSDSDPSLSDSMEKPPMESDPHTDFTSVYETVGRGITIDRIKEDPTTGRCFFEYEGKTYECGMDFLSMAMVYNTTVPAGGPWKSEEEVYETWWRLYVQRWNTLVPEVPLYAGVSYAVYNTNLQGFAPSPYGGEAEAVLSCTLKSGDEVTLGRAAPLTGAFRNAFWGNAAPTASDLDIVKLTSGYETLVVDADGQYRWNEDVLAGEPVLKRNDDGTATYTVRIRQDLYFSDGSAITAKNYIAALLADSTVVAQEAGGSGLAGAVYVGYEAFHGYTGEGDAVFFEGVKLIDAYTFSVTVKKEMADSYYSDTYAALSPAPLSLYLGEKGDIRVDPETSACGLNDSFYEKTGEGDQTGSYAVAAEIFANLRWDSGLPYTGPYTISEWDEAAKTVTLTRNCFYQGDRRGEAPIGTVCYVGLEADTQWERLLSGDVDLLCGLVGEKEIKAALSAVESGNGRFALSRCDRAGYAKLGFRCDFGPTGMTEVRQAVMYTIDREALARRMTGGADSLIHGPYYPQTPAYQANAERLASTLNLYPYSVEAAIEVLTDAGWVYNEKGEAFVPGEGKVRYKKLSGRELNERNLGFRSADGRYQTVNVGDDYYMPLVINWSGTQPSEMTDLLLALWRDPVNENSALGMYICYTPTDFAQGLYGDFGHEAGLWNGQWVCNAVNAAVAYRSAVYDYAWNWSLDPALSDAGFSVAYLKDEADFWENYQ